MEIKLLSCPLCMKPHFDDVDALRSSLISVATSQISCPVCDEILMGLDKLTIHLFSHITKDLVHEKLPTESPQVNEFVCSPGSNGTETSTKIAEDAKQIRCDICNFSFSDENILDIHQNLLHQTKADKKTGAYSYHCHLCSKKFNIKGSLMVHLRVAHFGLGQMRQEPNGDCKDRRRDGGTTEDSATNASEQFPVAVAKQSRENKQWECDVCLKSFTTKYFLKKHKRLHTGEMPYFCTQCNKFFTFQQSYHKHMLYHSSEKPHVCNECGRSFKELSTLHNHQRIHSGERPFACETCGKCFRQRVSLLVHRRIHTGVMPYKCTACGKSFRYKVSHKSHKCLSNPPGVVVRESNLLEKLMQKSANRNSEETGNIRFALSDENSDEGKRPNEIEMKEEDQKPRNQFNLVGCAKEEPKPHRKFIVSTTTEPIIQPQQYFYAADDINGDRKTKTCFGGNKETRKNYIIISGLELNKDMSAECVDTTESPDFFSLVLSPVLPEVELLSLSNPSSADDRAKQSLETINQESFKNLLYGPPE